MSSRFCLPAAGLPRDVLIGRLKAFQANDSDWRGGRVPIFVFHANAAVEEVSREAFHLFFSENAQAAAAFPGVAQMSDEVTGAALGLFHSPEQAAGVFTSGGTESIFLAVQCAREFARATGRGDPARHNMVIPHTGHPAFDKAARYLDLEVRRVPVGQGFEADPAAMRAAMDADTVLLLGSAPAFPHGVFDPLTDLSDIAVETGVWMHVDACVGGYLAPFAEQLGYDIPAFDFRLPGVRSISADLHKYAYSAKPASTLLFRNGDEARFAEFVFDDWPRGLYRSRTMTGTRPAGAVASAWAVLNFLGNEGLLGLAREVMQTRDRLIAGIRAIGRLQIQGNPRLGLISYGSDEVDIRRVGDGLEDRGWYVPRNASPPGIQFLTMPVHAPVADAYLADLAEAVEDATRSGGARQATVTY